MECKGVVHMTWKEHIPGEFPDISRGEYQRFVALAKRRLVGFEHHAEDVVSQALMKWTRISASRRGVARLEQVIKSEAYSFLRSERRSRDRDTRVFADPSLPAAGPSRPHNDHDVVLLRLAIAETSRRVGISLTTEDVEVFELLNAGYNLSDIVRLTDLSRHNVKSSRRKLQELISRTLLEPTADKRSAPKQ